MICVLRITDLTEPPSCCSFIHMCKIPEDLSEAVCQKIGTEEILLANTTDLTPDGEFGEQWLIVTEKQIAVAQRDNEAWIVEPIAALKDIESVKTVERAGLGALELLVNGECLRPLFYSDAKACEFQTLKWKIDRILGKSTDEEPETRTKKLCSKCNKPLPSGLTRCPRCTPKTHTIYRMFQFAKPHRTLIGFILLLTIVGTLSGLAVPYMSKLFIDYVFKIDEATGSFPHAKWHLVGIGVLLLAYALQCIFSALQERVSGIVGFRTVYDLRAALFERIQSLSLSFFDGHHTGSIMARVNQDTAELQRLMVDFLPMTLDCALMLLGVGTGLFILSWRLTLFVIMPVGAIILFITLVIPRIRVMFHRYFRYRSRLSAFVSDSLSGVRVVKSFGQETIEIDKFESKSSVYRDSGIALVKRWSLIHPSMHFLIMLGAVTVWLVGGRLIFRPVGEPGHMSLGSVVAYSGYLMMFYRPVFMVTRMSHMITNALSAAHRVFDVIDTEPEIKDSENAVAMPEIKGKVEFRNAVFGYEKHRPVIKGLSTVINANEKIGLVGKSGAGKSTLINLICRLYDLDQGQILIDDVDIRDIRYSDLRKHIGVVLQDSFLFSGTLFDNILYARPDATSEEVIDASMAARAHDFIIQKPDGYDTEVGERGDSLSGGEKQRIAIARAILRNPCILILDEPTSSVDVETEKHIQEALAELTRGRTTFAIAHRLSTLRDCDRLLVVEDGSIIEEGSHEELLANDGQFSRLAAIQNDQQRIVAVGG